LWRQYAPNVNSNLATVLDRAIRFNASDRFSTAKEMLNALQSGNDISQMDTVAVAPGGLPQHPNRSTPPSPQQTVPVGNTPAIQGNKRNPLVIAALVAAGFLVAGVGIGLSLSRTPAPSTSIASNSESTVERETSRQGTDSANSRSQPSVSEPISEPPSSRTSARRSQPAASEPGTIPTESRSQRESQTSSETPPQSSPSQPIAVPPPETSNNQNSNQSATIPGFAPGTQQSYVKEELGKPTKSTKGLWNTRALLYENYIPNQVSLGYLYDPSSGRVRQTEVSVAESVDLQTISNTLDRMLNNNATADIQQGLEKVYQNRSNRYRFVSGRNNSLKGIIERNEPGRIYIGVWEADLH
jgi:serine/threonine-protein kinase